MHNTWQSHDDDSFRNVTYRKNPTYFERVGSSLCGSVVGILVVIAAFPVLFLNEGRAVQTARSLDEGLASIEKLSASDHAYESNVNKLVHVSGVLKSKQMLTDDAFDVQIYAVKLKRHVEMLQWVEHDHKTKVNEGERTRVEHTYTYSKEWRSNLIDSQNFNLAATHQNPRSFLVDGYSRTAKPIMVGSFELSEALKEQVNNFKELDLHGHNSVPQFKISNNKFYSDVYSKVGDVRVTFSYAGKCSSLESFDHTDASKVSVVAGQHTDHQLGSYQTSAGDRLEMLHEGEVSAEVMFAAAHDANSTLTWILRLVGWLMMLGGFLLTMNIARQIVSFVPIVRDIVGLASWIISLTLASSLSLLVIAAGWLRYRPLLAMSLLAAALVPMWLSRRVAAQNKSDKEEMDHQS